jgi:hypothetical protein
MPRIPPGPWPVDCANAQPPATKVAAAMPPITRAFFFICHSNICATEGPLLMRINAAGLTEVFQAEGFL